MSTWRAGDRRAAHTTSCHDRGSPFRRHPARLAEILAAKRVQATA